jgi:uncharacterized membrane protein YvbJ
MGYCNECDGEYQEGAKFCPQCGSKTPEQRAAESIPNQAKHYVGAAAAVIAPIGLATGALIGAGIVAYRHVNKKKNQENQK